MGKEPPGKKEGCDCKRFLKNNWLLLSTILAVVLGESRGRPFGREGQAGGRRRRQAARAPISSRPCPTLGGRRLWRSASNVVLMWKSRANWEDSLEKNMQAGRFPLALLPKKG